LSELIHSSWLLLISCSSSNIICQKALSWQQACSTGVRHSLNGVLDLDGRQRLQQLAHC
jgi:hypothetical protein